MICSTSVGRTGDERSMLAAPKGKVSSVSGCGNIGPAKAMHHACSDCVHWFERPLPSYTRALSRPNGHHVGHYEAGLCLLLYVLGTMLVVYGYVSTQALNATFYPVFSPAGFSICFLDNIQHVVIPGLQLSLLPILIPNRFGS